MINILSYLGMSLQSEVCLWTLLGLVRTVFDATLFKVNANLKQVWQMNMPDELSLSVQRGLRTMISGVMLVQCFTVYVYLASYIVLLYPVFLEERPTLVLPWLLLAAIRKLLCELTSLALGLGTCVLLGPARPPCIKFVVIKVISIMPSFYMWMLLYSYYNVLKVASVFKTFSVSLPSSEIDYGLELAVRRRRAKSLLGEDQLRRRLISNCYNNHAIRSPDIIGPKTDYSTRMTHATDTNTEDVTDDLNVAQPKSNISNRMMSDTPVSFEDWLGHEIVIPRDTDRILEQFGIMMLRIGAYVTKEGINSNSSMLLQPEVMELKHETMNCTAMPPDSTDTPPLVGSSNPKTASYLRDYPHIFMKKPDLPFSLANDTSRQTHSSLLNKEENDFKVFQKWSQSLLSSGSVAIDSDISMYSKEISVNESEEKKQKRSTEKAVTFTQNKNISELNAENNNKNISDTEKYKLNNNNTSGSKDSLQSIIEEINKQRSLSLKSLEKDGNRYKTKQATFLDQNFSKSELKVLSNTSLEENEISPTTDKASSTRTAKKKIKENTQKKKKWQ